MEREFENRVAIVTGASSGIGRACALAYARRGAAVVVADVDDEGSTETERLISAEGGRAVHVHCDVADAADVEAMVNRTIELYGRLDFACNNAGIAGTPATTADYPEATWRRVIDVNLNGVWLCMKYEIPKMLASGGGSIVNMASILGEVGYATASAYVAAKHGVIGLTQSAAIEYATKGIRVNAVCPAFIYTPMLEEAGIVKGSDLYSYIAQQHPMKRFGTVDEIAEATMWLSSSASSFVTGHALLADGGYVAQ
ncbi:MAG: SDR family oxidoreductase [Bacteroidetes bacterium]|nr:SDR family oxidoreductase [Bacteroidota bacterium]